MGFVSDAVGDVFGSITGSTQAAEGAQEAARIQAESGREAIARQEVAAGRAQEFFEPFAGVSERGVEASQFLANPQAQFDFLQNNPLFNLALENANQRTLQTASAGRRLSFGDTLQQLSSNALLSAQPLIDRQRQDVAGLLDLGTNVAGSRANIEQGLGTNVSNLSTQIGNVLASGRIAAGQERAQTFGSVIGLGGAVGGLVSAFSDRRLKDDIRSIGNRGGHEWYTWEWNSMAGKLLGLVGSGTGVMAQEAMVINPQAVSVESGFYKVNYGAL